MTAKSLIFAHRGLWAESGLLPNSFASFQAALEEGFSLEVDIRDAAGEVVIAHDPGEVDVLNFESFASLISNYRNSKVAFNVKSDGLVPLVTRTSISNTHFFFDMSFPQQVQYLRANLPTASRSSEAETPNPDFGKFHWADRISSDWSNSELDSTVKLSEQFELSVFVSPELHKRDPGSFWDAFSNRALVSNKLGLCTDFPREVSFRWGLND